MERKDVSLLGDDFHGGGDDDGESSMITSAIL